MRSKVLEIEAKAAFYRARKLDSSLVDPQKDEECLKAATCLLESMTSKATHEDGQETRK